MESSNEIKEIEISTPKMVLKILKLFFFSLIKLRFYMPGIPEIKAEQLNNLLKSKQPPLILDTRDKLDFYALEGSFKSQGHIPSAKLLPLF